jgi:hypothetical protein
VVVLAFAFIPPLLHAGLSGARAFFRILPRSRWTRFQLATLTTALHFIQPAARLWGRLCYGLTPWRRRGSGSLVFPRPGTINHCNEGHWRSAEQRLTAFETALRSAGAAVVRGGEYDRWDLEVRGGMLGTARLLMVVEEHGAGRQYTRMRVWPMARPIIFLVACLFAGLAMRAALDLEWNAWALLNLPAIVLVGRTLYESGCAMAALRKVIESDKKPEIQGGCPTEIAPLAAKQKTSEGTGALKPVPGQAH